MTKGSSIAGLRSVPQILAESGPALSSEVVQYLRRRGVPSSAARKRIERAKGIQRFRHLSLPHRDRFLYLKSQVGSKEFWAALLTALERTRSAYGLALGAL